MVEHFGFFLPPGCLKHPQHHFDLVWHEGVVSESVSRKRKRFVRAANILEAVGKVSLDPCGIRIAAHAGAKVVLTLDHPHTAMQVAPENISPAESRCEI